MNTIKVGCLAKYLSRTILVLEIKEEWIYALELGSDTVGKYRKRVVKPLGE